MRYGCTACGRCCHNLRLSLSASEALDWLRRGGAVELLCDAWPDLPAGDEETEYRRRRSFAGISGSLPIRVRVGLVATFNGACPHLKPDMLCGAYELRPAVCRIYPAEISPFFLLEPATKQCPPEAWAPDKPLYAEAGLPVDPGLQQLITTARSVAVEDVPVKALLCRLLGISEVALLNEAFSVHAPDPNSLAKALEDAFRGRSADERQWSFVSRRRSTRSMIVEAGALVAEHRSGSLISLVSEDAADG